jgi:hypothetical protein
MTTGSEILQDESLFSLVERMESVIEMLLNSKRVIISTSVSSSHFSGVYFGVIFFDTERK